MVRMRYTGTGNYIPMIPSRDLSDYDIEKLVASNEQIIVHLTTTDAIVEYLISSGVYEIVNDFICAECGKPLKTWKALSKHEMKHIKELSKIETEKEQGDGNSTDSI